MGRREEVKEKEGRGKEEEGRGERGGRKRMDMEDGKMKRWVMRRR